MPQVPLLFQDAEKGANGGLAGRVVQVGQDLGRRGLAAAVDDLHDLPLTAAEAGSGWANHCLFF